MYTEGWDDEEAGGRVGSMEGVAGTSAGKQSVTFNKC